MDCNIVNLNDIEALYAAKSEINSLMNTNASFESFLKDYILPGMYVMINLVHDDATGMNNVKETVPFSIKKVDGEKESKTYVFVDSSVEQAAPLNEKLAKMSYELSKLHKLNYEETANLFSNKDAQMSAFIINNEFYQ